MRRDPDGFAPEDPSCWIAPNGKVHFVGEDASHSIIARILGDQNGGAELEGKGYLHVSYSSIMPGYDVRTQREIEPTQAQLDALFDIVLRVEAVLGKDEHIARRFHYFIQHNAPKESYA